MKRERIHLSAPSSAGQAPAGDDRIIDLLGRSFEEKPIWAGLYESLRDAAFPAKLPPLELTSTPVLTPDRMAAKTNPWAIGTATLANTGLVALLILLGLRTTLHPLPKNLPTDNIRLSDFTLFAPAPAQGGGSSGGGSHDLADPIQGRPPKQSDMPLAPVQQAVLDRPTLAIEPAVPLDLKLNDNSTLPNIGVHKSPNVSLASLGPGGPTGIGSGPNGGYGPGGGKGPGSGPGSGDSIYVPGRDGVTKPVPLVSPEAEFSDEARRNKYQGVCMISIIVDAHGNPQNPRVVRSLGMGLDEKAIEAVQRYRFKPATKDGKPVASILTVEVNFRLY